MNIHGEVSFSWENDVFILNINGPFNEEGIEHCGSLIKASILSRTVNQWNRLEIWNNPFGSPETLNAAKLVYDWYELNGCISTAVVTQNSIEENIVRDIFQSKATIFSDVNSAKRWLKMNINE